MLIFFKSVVINTKRFYHVTCYIVISRNYIIERATTDFFTQNMEMFFESLHSGNISLQLIASVTYYIKIS